MTAARGSSGGRARGAAASAAGARRGAKAKSARVSRNGAAKRLRNGAPRVTGAQLMAEAEVARRHAYAPYSRFRVGAALRAGGAIYEGANVENASYGLATCAERNAVWKAVSEGVGDFVAIAVTAEKGHGASPCGGCRQVLQEFAPDIIVYWIDGKDRMVRTRLDQLLARPFKLMGPRK